MPRTRAFRRHQRRRAIARRHRILLAYPHTRREDLTYKAMHWHLRCNCFELVDGRSLRRRREEREWPKTEASAW